LPQLIVQDDFGEQNTHTTMSMANVIKKAEEQGGICIAAHFNCLKIRGEVLRGNVSPKQQEIQVDGVSHGGSGGRSAGKDRLELHALLFWAVAPYFPYAEISRNPSLDGTSPAPCFVRAGEAS
jgi:hypothetical protein